MNTVNLAKAKAHLSDLVAHAESGEPVCITRRGRPVARLTAVATPHRPIALSTLRALTDSIAETSRQRRRFHPPNARRESSSHEWTSSDRTDGFVAHAQVGSG